MPILDMTNHYVKWTSPTEIVKWNPEDNTSETVVLQEQTVTFPRDIRGGSQVITVGDYFIALTHEVDLWKNDQDNKDAHYYHRFIVWDKSWNIVASSEEFKFMTANIEFSCGLLFDGSDFIIPFGFQDSTAFILKLPGVIFEQLIDYSLNVEYKQSIQNPTPKKLESFILNPFNPKNNFQLGEYYFNQGHTASALAFYLRSAEYGDDSNDIYESLLMVARCLAVQGKRSTTEKGLWLNAISFAPNRPEAYLFLSEWSESNNQYHEAYMYAAIGLTKLKNAKKITDNVKYLGGYQLEFQKAVLAWWIGRTEESKQDFLKLSKKISDFDVKYQDLINTNLSALNLI